MCISGGQANFFSSSLWVDNISGGKKEKNNNKNGQHFPYGSLHDKSNCQVIDIYIMIMFKHLKISNNW